MLSCITTPAILEYYPPYIFAGRHRRAQDGAESADAGVGDVARALPAMDWGAGGPQWGRLGISADPYQQFVAKHGGAAFRDLTQNRIRRGIFRDVEELIMAIGDYIDKHNHRPKPFVWTAKASDILEKVKRARVALDNR